MKNIIFNSLVAICAITPTILFAQGGPSQNQYSILPRVQQSGASPLIMLALSNDHQLYFKAYTDYDDLNNDGKLDLSETSYHNAKNYGGYFSSAHCYSYTNGVFTISSETSNHYCSGATEWSGNFLNWATMTRIDMLRHVLYGGKRYDDGGSPVVLERSYLPNDAHSFAKYYNKDDLADLTPYTLNGNVGITLCNTTLHTGDGQKNSRTNTNPPLMRAIPGNYSLWASNERYQCLLRDNNEGLNGNKGVAVADAWGAPFDNAYESVDPALGFGLGVENKPNRASPTKGQFDAAGGQDFYVRIAACSADYLTENCKAYEQNGVTVYRPTGILHEFPSESQALWGLLSGSYENNKEGGYLRKNISEFSDEIGGLGQALEPDAGGIISSINAFRIAGWKEFEPEWNNNLQGDNVNINFNGIAYNETWGNSDSCFWGRKEFGNGHCVDWGNPFGEILAESYRYFAGLDGYLEKNKVSTDDEAAIENATIAPSAVKVAPWKPVTSANFNEYACSSLNVIGLNTSAQTFDDNLADFITGLPGAATGMNAATNSLLQAGSTRYFVGDGGETVTQNNVDCSPKQLLNGNLSNAQGVCFDAPGKHGTWHGAGLAKIMSGLQSNDFDAYDMNASLDNSQKVTTHGLQLATALPQVKIATGEKSVTLSPACENWGDARGQKAFSGNCGLVDFRVLEMDEAAGTGTLYVNWEENQQGGDYDQDMHGLIQYALNGSQLIVKTKVLGQSTEKRLGFGYILSGTDSDGLHIHSGINGYPGQALAGSTNYDSGICTGQTANARVYAAHDNAEITNGVQQIKGCDIHTPITQLTHTISDASGDAKQIDPLLKLAAEGSGGVYAKVNDPSELESKLRDIVLGAMSDKPIGASEVATSGVSAGGLFLHTLSYPQKNDGGDRVNWVGQVGALRVDEKNRLRDADNNVLKFVQDGNASRVEVTAANGGGVASYIEFDQINYFWSTTDTLAAQSNRRIYTAFVEPNGDDFVETDLVRPQVLTEFTTDIAGDLDAASFIANENVADVIEYVRGGEAEGQRSRTLADKTYLLGDIQTSPLVQSVPDYSYASELGDGSYQSYIDAYKNARNVVYVASNDGMIHAINGGVKDGDGFASGGAAEGGTVALGEELWAYVPLNLLPHLQWLPREDYAHVPYFDGYMRTFDVKAWGEGDAIHVGGWGTILVVGTGMGAGHFPLSLDDNPNDAEVVTKPAYIVLDITNRNATQPTLIAEISHEQLGFTTAEPDVIRRVVKSGDTETSEWYLVFGSGPRGDDAGGRRTAQTTYTLPAVIEGDENDSILTAPYLFSFKLGDGDAELETTEVDIAGAGAFIGAINGMDWDRDFVDDAIYFGTIAGDQTNPTGQLLRAVVSFNGGLSFTPSVMYNTGKPVVARPVTVINQRDHWVFAGTGRYYVREDADQDHNGNMYLGIMEDIVGGSISGKLFTQGDLFSGLDGIEVDTGGNLYTAEGDAYSLNGVDMPKIDNLRNHIKNHTDGWLRSFGNSNQRQHTQAGYLASTLFVGTTEPGASTGCNSSDRGRLYVWDMRSGVPSPYVTGHTKKLSVNSSDTPVDAIDVPIEFDGAAPDINDPASQLMNLADGSVSELPELDLNIPSQRHSWREVTIPW